MHGTRDNPGGYSNPNQRLHQTPVSSTNTPSYVDLSGQPLGYHPLVQGDQVQRQTYGHSQDPRYQALVASNPAALPSIPIAQQSGSFVNPQYPPQHNASDAHRTRALLNPGIPPHFQNYRPIEHGQPVVPSQPNAQYFAPQSHYPNPAMQTRDGHLQYSDPAFPPSTMSGYPPSPSSSSSLTHACDVCGATFTRPQNLKRHYESQHTTMEHICPYCQKSYTRVDSLKRHLDRPCDKMPQFAQGGA